MATPIKSLFPPIKKKPFLLNKQKSGSRRLTSCIDMLEGECSVSETSINTLRMRCDKPSGWSDHLEWAKGCLGDSGNWEVWQVPVNLATNALRMVSLETLQNASMCWRNKRTNCPHKWQTGWLLELLPLMCSNHQWTVSHVQKSARRPLAIFRLLFALILIGSLESPPSNSLKATRKPDVLVLSEICG